MTHPLEACRAKIRRARMHVAEFAEAVRTQISVSPYRVHGKVDTDNGQLVVSAETNQEFCGIPLFLPLIAGEVAHQLRSALDHLIWQLVVVHTGGPPTGTKSGFPIFSTKAGYDRRAPSMIAGVSPNAATRIHAAQPFHAGADAARVLSWALHELNNADKHRLIPVTIEHTSVIHLRMQIGSGLELDLLPPQLELRPPLTDGAEIMRVPLTDEMDDVTFNVRFGFDVAFRQLGAVERHPATQLLGEMTDYVDRLIESFAREFVTKPIVQ